MFAFEPKCPLGTGFSILVAEFLSKKNNSVKFHGIIRLGSFS